jgi:glycosyltransferase involved in cell wall biosynthesis
VQLLENYDIFCLTSRFEGFGLSALEAMVAGRVLLVSAESGIAPYVQASGCGVTIAPTRNGIHQGFATLLERRAQWPEMGLRGRCYALKYLQWEPIAESALVQYRSLIPGAMEMATVVPEVTESEDARLIRVG